ncbi:hypothetical protein RYT94_004611 [Salmonella enterica]|nr:hypothetical protein [Salmonella enterica]
MRKLQRLAIRCVHGTVKRIKLSAIHRPFVTGVHPTGTFVHDGMKMVVVIPPDLCLKTQITGVISDPFTFAVTDMWKISKRSMHRPEDAPNVATFVAPNGRHTRTCKVCSSHELWK